MKGLSATLVFCLTLLVGTYAQQALFSNWQLGKIGISTGGDQDMISDLNHTYLLSTIKGPTAHDYSNINFEEEDLSSMVCDNAHLRLTVAFSPPGLRNTEIRMNVVHIGNRVDMVSFSGQDDQGNERDLHFHLCSQEIALEAVALKKLSLGRNVHFYGGMGTNTGYSYNNELEVSGGNLAMMPDGDLQFRVTGDTPVSDVNMIDEYSQYYEASDALHQRAFIQAGVGVTLFRTLELNFDLRRGIGYRAHKGADAKFTQLRSSSIGLYWYVFQ